ncbi:MAG: hypothetical protein J6W28_04625 [Clostridia bacterium]|nr:hypothetical protein [Clostridia bacterium]
MNSKNLFLHLPLGSSIHVVGSSEAQSAERVLLRYAAERGFLLKSKVPDLHIHLEICEHQHSHTEEFRLITTPPATVTICSPSKAGLLFGIGEFLRRISFHADGSADIPILSVYDKPVMSWRAVMTCYHNQDNGYKYWDTEKERLYLEEMALWGNNMAMFSPINMWQRHSNTFVDGTPESASWETMPAMPAIAQELGLRYGMLNVPNDLFSDDLLYCKRAVEGSGQMIFASTPCGCPSDPKGRETMLKRRRQLFSRMSHVDFLYIHPADYGACSCAECGPYIPTYLDLAKDVAAIMRLYHPHAKIYVGTVLITEEGVKEHLIPYLNSKESDWIDGVAYGMHGTALSLPELKAAIPKRLEVVLYPEITMMENWGQIGASPWIRRFAYSLEKRQDMGKACNAIGRWPEVAAQMFGDFPTAFDPDTMHDMINGAFMYSEGLHDEVAKIIWLRYAWKPDTPREEILRDYCRFYYGEEAAEMAFEALLGMEEITLRRCSKQFRPALTTGDDGTGLDKCIRILDLVTQMKAVMPAFAANHWRYLMLELRARLDLLAFETLHENGTWKEVEIILDLAEEIYKQSSHVNLLPAGRPWSREEAAVYLNKLITRTFDGKAIAPISPEAST